MNDSEMAGRIHEAAMAHGFEVCGIVRIAEMAGYAEAIAGRIERYPQSRPMYERLAGLAAPEQNAPWAKSVVVCARSYSRYRLPGHLNGRIGKSYIFDSRKDPRSREHRDSVRFEAALTDMGLRHMVKRDYGITAMRWAAACAGIGMVRKNNFFYTANGSWCALEAFLIDRELELKASPTLKKCPDNCGRCMKACPTGALGEPFQMNGVACVSFLTSRAECAPGKANYDKCGGWIFGHIRFSA